MANVNPANYPWHFPNRAREIIETWPAKCKSPYSHSYYDQEDGVIGWDFKPIGSLRISDHWNFKSNGRVHCCTDVLVADNHWAVGVWDGNRYTIIETMERRPLRLVPDNEVNRLKPSFQKKRLKAIQHHQQRIEHFASL